MSDADGPEVAFTILILVSMAFLLLAATFVGAIWWLSTMQPVGLVPAARLPTVVDVFNTPPPASPSPTAVTVPAMIFQATPALATATPTVQHEVHLPLLAVAAPTVAPTVVEPPTVVSEPMAFPTPLFPTPVFEVPTFVPTGVPVAPAPTMAATYMPSPIPTATFVIVSDCACDQGDVLNCKDLENAPGGAQACFDRCKALTGNDVHKLDNNNNGQACEDY